MSKNNSQRLITYADIQTFELRGAAVMAMPAGKQRWSAAMELCQQIMEAEPQAFDVAKGWIKSNMSYMPVVAFFEPFGTWVMRHWSLSPVGEQKWLKLGEMLAASSVEVSPYSMKAIAIYTVLRAQVPAPQRDSQPIPHIEVDERLQTDEAKAVLSILERLEIPVKGKGIRQVLNTTTTPWGYASNAALSYTAKCVGNILGITEKWHVFEQACGVKNLQSKASKEPIEVKQALEKAGYFDFDR